MNNQHEPDEQVAGTGCAIEDWKWHWSDGYLSIDGILKPGFTGSYVTIAAYRVDDDGSRGAYYGHGLDAIGPLGNFEVNIKGPSPGEHISIRCACE